MENNEDRIVQHEQEDRKRPLEWHRKMPWFVIVISALGLIVILFAFVMEARANRQAARLESEQLHSSAIQAEINGLDWVEQVLLTINPFSRSGRPLVEVNGIVIHNIGNPDTTALQNWSFFEGLAISQERHASSNFIICLDGDIIQCIPVDEIAYASNHRNDDTLSIEVCHPDDTGKFTEESYAAAVRLTAWLCVRYNLTSDDVIRHFDVQGKECPRYFVDNEDAWEAFRADVAREIERESARN